MRLISLLTSLGALLVAPAALADHPSTQAEPPSITGELGSVLPGEHFSESRYLAALLLAALWFLAALTIAKSAWPRAPKMVAWGVAAVVVIATFAVGMNVRRAPEQSQRQLIMEIEGPDRDYGQQEYLVVEPAGAPRVRLIVTQDPSGPFAGWILQIVTHNFVFAPERASGAHRPGEGHAHVSVDGQQVARAYGEWHHLDGGLSPGEHTVEVLLATNSHLGYSAGGVPVLAQAIIVAP